MMLFHDENNIEDKMWGPHKNIKIHRQPLTNLGLTILGGRIYRKYSTENISDLTTNTFGIFIKHVIPNSSAGKCNILKPGDKIIQVNGKDLRNISYKQAVKAFQSAQNPLYILVQSLTQGTVHASEYHFDEKQNTHDTMETNSLMHKNPISTIASLEQSGMRNNIYINNTIRDRHTENNDYSSDESSNDEDIRELEGNVYTKSGKEISRKSAGNVKLTEDDMVANDEEEDEYGYTRSKIIKKYGKMKNSVILVSLEKDRRGLGILVAGHKDRNIMASFICGLQPDGTASKNGKLEIGDEILEVNGMVFQGRCHLNISVIIKAMGSSNFKIIVYRCTTGNSNLAVNPLIHIMLTHYDYVEYKQYKGVREIAVRKTQHGLGIMIIEGRHVEVGSGIFISDVQEGSAAESGGLNVGDLILAVNMDNLLGSSYDEALCSLKRADGIVTFTVCNPNQSSESERASAEANCLNTSFVEETSPQVTPADKVLMPQNPKERQIQNEYDTMIEITKDVGMASGIFVVGGTNTLVKAVFVLDVFPNGAIGKDGRIMPGDRIVDFCKNTLNEKTNEEAQLSIMKISTDPLSMTVYRSKNLINEYEVDLLNKPGKGIGLRIMEYKNGRGSYIEEVITGGSAFELKKIEKGDKIIEIDGQEFQVALLENIAFCIKMTNSIHLKLSRYMY